MMFKVWSSTDIFVLCFVAVHPVIVLVDLKYGISEYLIDKFQWSASRVDVMFGFFLLLLLGFFFIESQVHQLALFLSIVDYPDARMALLRWDIIRTALLLYISAGFLSVCWWIYLKLKVRSVKNRYLFYFLVYNALAVFYLSMVMRSQRKNQ